MKITIRRAEEEDFPAIFALISELAEFEKAPEQVTNSVEQMKHEKELFQCFVAETQTHEIVGMALYFFAYFTWVGKSLYLDDLYIKPEYRKQKIGTALLEKVFEVAREEQCNRVRWQVLDWNQPAIRMYEKYGATIEDQWLNCDFDREGIRKFRV